MKNKNLHKPQLELIELLLNAVNSAEEFDYLQAEKSRLVSFYSYTDERRCSK